MLNDENLLMYFAVFAIYALSTIATFKYFKLKENFLKISLIVIVFLWSSLIFDSTPAALFMSFSWGQEDILNYTLSISTILLYFIFNYKTHILSIRELVVYYFTILLMFLLSGTTNILWIYSCTIIIFLLNKLLFVKKSNSLFDFRFLVLTLYLFFSVLASGDGNTVLNESNRLFMSISGGLSIFVLLTILFPYNVFNKDSSCNRAISHSFITIPLIYSKWLMHIQDLYLELTTDILMNLFYLSSVLIVLVSLLILLNGFQKNRFESYYAIFANAMLLILPIVFHTSISNTDLMDINKYSVLMTVVLLLSFSGINRLNESKLDTFLSRNLLLFSAFLIVIVSSLGRTNLILPLWSVSNYLIMILASIGLVFVIISVRLLKISYKPDQFNSNISYNSIGTVIVLLIYYGIIVYK